MFTTKQQDTINEAIQILKDSLVTGEAFNAPSTVASYCQLEIGHLDHEVFGVLFLNNQHQLISFDILFRGTIDQSAVYPREVAKTALLKNAAATILTHNHPSGICEPSSADKAITDRLSDALNLLDIRTLDHIIVGKAGYYSFAEKGLL